METTCQKCSKVVHSQILPHLEHKEGAQQTDKRSCTETRMQKTLCAICKQTISEVYLMPTQHIPGEWKVERKVTCAVDGSYTATCTVCGEKLSRLVSHPDYGDIDADNKITSNDARLALRASVALERLSETAAAAADLDADGRVEASDARMLLRITVKLDDKDALFKKYYKA